MKEVSELFELAKKATPGRNYDRLDSCGGGIKYQCLGNDGSLVLQCDHKNNEYGFIGPKSMEDEAFFLACKPETILAIAEAFQALEQQLTNAQEALKSAGIEADTVQAGVMELVRRMNQVVTENVELKESVEHAAGCIHAAEVEGLEDALKRCDGERLADLVHRRLCHAYLHVETPATEAYLNAVRAEGRAEGVEMLAEHHLWKAEVFANAGDVINSKSRIKMYNITEDFAAQLRAGNSGKDGSHE